MKATRNGVSVTLLLAACTAGAAGARSLAPAPAGAPGSLLSASPNTLHPTPYALHPSSAGAVVVRFRDGVGPARWDQMVGSVGCRIVRADPAAGYALVQVRDGRASDMLAFLGRRAEVLHAEPSYRLHVLDQSYYNPYEWYLFDRGTMSAKAVSNFGIQAASAWNTTRGAGVTVAVVDSGAAFEDYNSFQEAPALADTHFAAGYDILDSSDHPDDDNGHGTHVTGVLAGNLVNGGGVVGVAPDVTVMPVKVMDSDGGGLDYNIAEGIRWAADHGAQVINLSLGGAQAGPVLADAVNYAAGKDCVLVAAAGNENASQVAYPAGYANCIAVGATGFDGARAPYSNRGRNLEVMAPGGNMTEDLNGDGKGDGIVAQTFNPSKGFGSFSYLFAQGTSEASPMVAGVAALVRAANPDLSALDVRIAIRSTALPLGSPTPRNSYYGYGLVDAKAAVEAAVTQKAGGA